MSHDHKDLVQNESRDILNQSGYVYRGQGVWERLSPLEVRIQQKREERRHREAVEWNRPINRFLRWIGVKS